jgi:proteasome lid subunit RPN8/RPN11
MSKARSAGSDDARGEGRMTVAPRVLCLPEPVASRIADHARREQPHECCGLLLGTASRIVEAVPARNIAPKPSVRYTIDPDEHFAAIRLARSRGLEVVGAYHSHVRSPARPSETDRAEAFSDFVFLIVSLADAEPELTGWELRAGNFVPVSLVRTP